MRISRILLKTRRGDSPLPRGRIYMGWKENKAQRDIQYQKDKIKRIPLNMQMEAYQILKTYAGDMPMNTFIKKALNAYTGQEIFKV